MISFPVLFNLLCRSRFISEIIFLLPERNIFSFYCNASLLIMDYLSLWVSNIYLFLPLFLRGGFTGYRILDCPSCFHFPPRPRPPQILFHCLPGYFWLASRNSLPPYIYFSLFNVFNFLDAFRFHVYHCFSGVICYGAVFYMFLVCGVYLVSWICCCNCIILEQFWLLFLEIYLCPPVHPLLWGHSCRSSTLWNGT